MIVLLFLLSAILCPSSLHAEDDEAAEAAKEDAEAAKLDGEIRSPLNGMVFSGKFVAQAGEGDKPVVVGTFKSATGVVYLVKPENDEVRQQLAKCNNKDCNIYGKLRNQAKYLIAFKAGIPEDPPAPRGKKKGF